LNREKAAVESLLEWHHKNRRVFPWRVKRDPYRVLVAEFFLQRTPANRVAAFLPSFLTEFPSPEKLANANPSYLWETFHRLGLKKRMSWLVQATKTICQKYGGKIPDTMGELMSLTGVGEYTASAVLCFGFGRDIPIVDANVVRVFTRIFGLPETHRTGSVVVKELAQRLLPTSQAVAYNEALLDLAALICKKRPVCSECPVKGHCNYYLSYC